LSQQSVSKKCSLHELLTMLQKYASGSLINMHQEGFGSYIVDIMIKEKMDRYKQEAMIPSKLGDICEPKIHVTMGKITRIDVLDLGSNVSAIPKKIIRFT
jgi:hypothetical protein